MGALVALPHQLRDGDLRGRLGPGVYLRGQRLDHSRGHDHRVAPGRDCLERGSRAQAAAQHALPGSAPLQAPAGPGVLGARGQRGPSAPFKATFQQDGAGGYFLPAELDVLAYPWWSVALWRPAS